MSTIREIVNEKFEEEDILGGHQVDKVELAAPGSFQVNVTTKKLGPTQPKKITFDFADNAQARQAVDYITAMKGGDAGFGAGHKPTHQPKPTIGFWV